jgi:hypothetical protein
MRLTNGHEIQDGDRVRVVVNDFLAFGGDGLLVPATPAGGFPVADDLPMVRDVLVDWFAEKGGRMDANQYLGPENLRWQLPDPLPQACLFTEQ